MASSCHLKSRPFLGRNFSHQTRSGASQLTAAFAEADERMKVAPVVVCNVCQDPLQHKSLLEFIPTLMTGTSKTFMIKSPGFAIEEECWMPLPKEALGVMGFPVFNPLRCSLADALLTLSQREIEHLAGNTFIISVVVCRLFWFLAFVDEIDVAQDSPLYG